MFKRVANAIFVVYRPRNRNFPFEIAKFMVRCAEVTLHLTLSSIHRAIYTLRRSHLLFVHLEDTHEASDYELFPHPILTL